jgi:hypothetical protein
MFLNHLSIILGANITYNQPEMILISIYQMSSLIRIPHPPIMTAAIMIMIEVVQPMLVGMMMTMMATWLVPQWRLMST